MERSIEKPNWGNDREGLLKVSYDQVIVMDQSGKQAGKGSLNRADDDKGTVWRFYNS
jgi:hypothetical protein